MRYKDYKNNYQPYKINKKNMKLLRKKINNQKMF